MHVWYSNLKVRGTCRAYVGGPLELDLRDALGGGGEHEINAGLCACAATRTERREGVAVLSRCQAVRGAVAQVAAIGAVDGGDGCRGDAGACMQRR